MTNVYCLTAFAWSINGHNKTKTLRWHYRRKYCCVNLFIPLIDDWGQLLRLNDPHRIHKQVHAFYDIHLILLVQLKMFTNLVDLFFSWHCWKHTVQYTIAVSCLAHDSNSFFNRALFIHFTFIFDWWPNDRSRDANRRRKNVIWRRTIKLSIDEQTEWIFRFVTVQIHVPLTSTTKKVIDASQWVFLASAL